MEGGEVSVTYLPLPPAELAFLRSDGDVLGSLRPVVEPVEP